MNQKVFDNFPTAKCEECECYWNNQCDGVPEGDARNCTAYRATKTTDIPKRLQALEETCEMQRTLNILCSVVLILDGIVHLIG